jgi:hypothetical protein
LRVFMIKANKLSKFFEYFSKICSVFENNPKKSDISAELCLKKRIFRCIIIVQVEQSGD